MKPIIVTAATFRELALLARAAGTERLPENGRPWEGHRCSLGGKAAVLAVTGLGKVNTGSAVTSLIERYSPSLLINTGCAGAYTGSGLQVGELAIATAEIYGDDGVLAPEGWESLEMIGIPVLKRAERSYFNEFPLSSQAAERADCLAKALGIDVRRGKFVTVSTCSGTSVRGAELEKRFGAICENMEGAAAAHIALLYGVDCLEVRGISNPVEDRDLSRWNIPLAVENAQRFILKYIESL